MQEEVTEAQQQQVFYSTKRRLQLARFLALPFLAIQIIQTIIITIDIFANGHMMVSSILAYLCVLGGDTITLTSFFRLRLAKQSSAITTFVVGIIIVFITFAYIWISNHGLDTLGLIVIATLSMVLVLVGIITDNLWALLRATGLVNLATISIFALAAHDTRNGLSGSIILPIVFACVIQWGFASLTLSAMFSYTSTLNELISTRVAFDHARKLDEIKEQFIMNVNHELRGPVMAVQGYIELYQLTSETLTSEQRNVLIDQASLAGKDLVTLLQSILDMRRLDQGTDDFVPEQVDLRMVIDTATQMVDPRETLAIPRDLRLHIPEGLVILGETVRLRQVLANLLSNAIKYSRPGTPIDISAHVVESSSLTNGRTSRHRNERDRLPTVEITIRDYGYGIPPQMIPLLFNRFVRLPRELASNITGNGLGLYLCKTLIEAMQGKIWIESEGIDEQGTTIYIQLPQFVAVPQMRRAY